MWIVLESLVKTNAPEGTLQAVVLYRGTNEQNMLNAAANEIDYHLDQGWSVVDSFDYTVILRDNKGWYKNITVYEL